MKGRHDNTNEDGWLRPAYLTHLIVTLPDQYFYSGQSGEQGSPGFRHSESRACHMCPRQTQRQTNNNPPPPPHPQDGHVLPVVTGIFSLEMGSCIIIWKSCAVVCLINNTPRLLRQAPAPTRTHMLYIRLLTLDFMGRRWRNATHQGNSDRFTLLSMTW